MWESIVNPKTGKKINIKKKKGQQIINRYLSQLGGSAKTEDTNNKETKKNLGDYDDLPVAKVVSYNFPEDGSGSYYELENTPIDIGGLAEIYGEELDDIIIKLEETDETYLKLLDAARKQENSWREGIEKPKRTNVIVSIQNTKCFNPKWTNTTDEQGRKLFSCDAPEEVAESEEIYKKALRNWMKIENGYKNYSKAIVQEEKEKKRRLIEDLFNDLKDGDIIENLNRNGMHDRYSGWYIMRNGIPHILSEIENMIDDESFPKGFSLGPKFPVGYWNNARSINGEHFPTLLEPINISLLISLLEKREQEYFIDSLGENSLTVFNEKTGNQKNYKSIVYFDWGALEFPYPKNDIVKEIKILEEKYERLYFEKISRGISRLVRRDAWE